VVCADLWIRFLKQLQIECCVWLGKTFFGGSSALLLFALVSLKGCPRRVTALQSGDRRLYILICTSWIDIPFWMRQGGHLRLQPQPQFL
jgi:hypothetical protein